MIKTEIHSVMTSSVETNNFKGVTDIQDLEFKWKDLPPECTTNICSCVSLSSWHTLMRVKTEVTLKTPSMLLILECVRPSRLQERTDVPRDLQPSGLKKTEATCLLVASQKKFLMRGVTSFTHSFTWRSGRSNVEPETSVEHWYNVSCS